MVPHCFAKSESRTILLSHHRSTTLPPRKKQQHTNLCRGTSLYATTAPPPTRFDSRALLSLLVVFLSWSSLFVAASAADTHGNRLAPLLVEDDLAWKGSSLYLDPRPPPIAPLLMPPLHSNQDATRTLSAPRSKRSIATDPDGDKTDFAIPRPFDTGLSNNFTSSCASFLSRLIRSDAFNNCHPFSLMLQTSSAFFDASKSYLRITQTLDATCGVNATQCRATLNNFARDLVSATACKTDYENDNPLVLQAYNGLVAYTPSYQASCLRDNAGSYCFANAVSNSSSTTDSYPYYLPIGQELPGGSRPTCNTCLQDVMSVFANYGNNATQPLSKTYTMAAQQISISCGKTFVNVTAAPLKGAAATTSSSLTPTITLILMFILYIFQ
ncbi:uncharacterized protein K460DRAFT_409761 [Cucurbitaria berberidis CBS 394.84]|uniref:DUF7729 domain-containing protein n=1 Tax=Cucurbitaria berberidis CBS 394.84 TaxID=1168544 RepID=A0A9P4L4W7_9PLEO|nr:uncharacterized protein K460DRAFT_409761 [Cucurbitaria berberidis CBS 394.84]KAF1842346.1 hypothetical protein K460DRAFT_409761 [Cucurbitaria berberidis CBS 394.84]